MIVDVSPSPDQLTDDERIEYQQINEFARHDDTVTLAVSSVVLPALFAALAWAWTQPIDIRAPLALGSLVIWLYWAAVTQRRGEFAVIRYKRAWELECKADLQHHLRIAWADRRQGFWQRWQRIKSIETLGSLTVTAGWIWLLFTPFAARSDVLLAFGLAAAVMVMVKVTTKRKPKEPPCEEPDTRSGQTEARHKRSDLASEAEPRAEQAITEGRSKP
jgi:hypothetical protein